MSSPTMLKHSPVLLFLSWSCLALSTAVLAQQVPMKTEAYQHNIATCPSEHVCWGDILSFSWNTNPNAIFEAREAPKWSYEGSAFYVNTTQGHWDSYLPKDYTLVKQSSIGTVVGRNFHGIYISVLPDREYSFAVNNAFRYKPAKVTYDDFPLRRIKYKSNNSFKMDSLIIADRMTPPPPVPKCESDYADMGMCMNQLVHLFWKNDRSDTNKNLINVTLFVDGKAVKSGWIHFHDFWYTIPKDKYANISGWSGNPIHVSVVWTYESRKLSGHLTYEHSLGLDLKFNYIDRIGWCYEWVPRKPQLDFCPY